MRNTTEYPITKEEIAEYLQSLIDELSYDKTKLIGDIRPLLLTKAKEIVLKGR